MAIPPLSDDELKLKNVYLSHPEVPMTGPIQLGMVEEYENRCGFAFHRVLPIHMRELVSSDDIFTGAQSLILYRCYRYFPAISLFHPCPLIYIVKSGECDLYVENVKRHLKVGDICIIGPNSSHAISVFSDECICFGVAIRDSAVDRLFWELPDVGDPLHHFLAQSLFDDHAPAAIRFRSEGDLRITHIYEDMETDFEHPALYNQQILMNLLQNMFILLCRDHTHTAEEFAERSSRVPDAEMINIMHYISANYADLTLTELARTFNYSERHISRLLKNYCGQSFQEIIRDIRLMEAAALLCLPDLSIEAVGEHVGYPDTSAFYKAFRSYYGMTPSVYRNAVRGNNINNNLTDR